jgi:hypothetical protein
MRLASSTELLRLGNHSFYTEHSFILRGVSAYAQRESRKRLTLALGMKTRIANNEFLQDKTKDTTNSKTNLDVFTIVLPQMLLLNR